MLPKLIYDDPNNHHTVRTSSCVLVGVIPVEESEETTTSL